MFLRTSHTKYFCYKNNLNKLWSPKYLKIKQIYTVILDNEIVTLIFVMHELSLVSQKSRTACCKHLTNTFFCKNCCRRCKSRIFSELQGTKLLVNWLCGNILNQLGLFEVLCSAKIFIKNYSKHTKILEQFFVTKRTSLL